MINVKFYLDKADKSKNYPIHLVLRKKDVHIKIAVGEKINKSDWDNANQLVLETEERHKAINKYLDFLRQECEKFFETTPHSQFTDKKIKEMLLSLVNSKKSNSALRLLNEPSGAYSNKKKVTFIDLFAGAGGFSEGLLQAETEGHFYDFLLASDINENCELTHLARYNAQLGLGTEFLRQDITEPDFMDNLFKKLGGQTVDVVCGGPPCQSFSLAGKRKKYDKKDGLFSHYLKAIRQLRPKYFVMENVKGILTKEEGAIGDMILKEIRSIVDLKEFHQLLAFVQNLGKNGQRPAFILECYMLRLRFEMATEKQLEAQKGAFIQNLEGRFRQLTPKIVDYKTSKTDPNILTIRHGFNLLKRTSELAFIRKKIINEKSFSDLDNDLFVADFDRFLGAIEPFSIIERMDEAFAKLKPSAEFGDEIAEIIRALEIYGANFDECMDGLRVFAKNAGREGELLRILEQIQLYNIDRPIVALAADYGVPQNRERVLFIGCRKDQKLVSEIPPTVASGERVTVFEALYDLDFIGNDEEKFVYEPFDLKARFNGKSAFLNSLIKKRAIDGMPATGETGLTYAEWSKKGRLNGRFANPKNPFYVKNLEELNNALAHFVAPLHNHKTSKQNDEVVERLEIILKTGDYDKAKAALKTAGLESEKRNYNVLKPESQSPTMMTIADDYIHYSNPRALTVREMARLQSFDDSFVFQGKRSTGGSKRKYEVPQFTLVGNAIPPLMARALAIEILKNIC